MRRGVVLYDGHCRLCAGSARCLASLARPGAVEMRDFQAAGVLDAYPQVSREECMRALQLVAEDGRVFSGAEAVARVLATRPLAGAAARLYFVPGIRQAADAAYGFVARNRYRFLGRNDACEGDACALHRVER
jgi:predicted DCC family thiol-disulfide oxidoreductase YuxK